MIQKFLLDDDGASLIEYALIAALISIVAIATLTQVGTNVNTTFQSIRDALPS
jgi:pilus assembly protein Flp/PilA